MLKVIFSVLGSVFITTITLVIFFWRDSQYEPSAIDLAFYLIALPLAISLLLLSPYLFVKWRNKRKDNLLAKETTEAEQAQGQIEAEKSAAIIWKKLNIYSSAIKSGLGSNQALLEAIWALEGPNLDPELTDAMGNPILSYRIQDLDLEQNESQLDFELEDSLHARIYALIQNQLQHHAESLTAIAEHLKQSALFYDNQLAYEYKMHPAWFNPHAEDLEEEHVIATEPISKLKQFNICMILSEQQLHHWDEHQNNAYLTEYLDQFGVLGKHINIKYLYLSRLNDLESFLNHLMGIEQEQEQVSLVIAVDSELNQEIIDEKIWVNPNYVSSEFSASMIVAAESVKIQNLDPLKNIDLIFNQPNLLDSLNSSKLNQLDQFKQDRAFVSVLENPKQSKVYKQLQLNFAQSGIENQHFYYSKSSLGDSNELAKIFGFMLALQLEEPELSMIYSTEHPMTQMFIQSATPHESV